MFLFIILIDIGCKFVVGAKLRFCWMYFNYIILIDMRCLNCAGCEIEVLLEVF